MVHALATSAATMLAASCRQQATSGSAEPAGAPKPRPTPYTVQFMGLPSSAFLEEEFALFNEEHRDQRISIAYDAQPGQTELFAKFQASVAGGVPPDVVRLKESWVFEMAAAGALAKLDGYLAQDRELARDLMPRFQDTMKYRSNHYGISREGSILHPYYNRELFRQVGLNPDRPPQTYDEFREHARRLTSAEKGQWGFEVYEYGTREIILVWYLGMVRRFGGDFWTPDRSGVDLTTQPAIDALTFFTDLIHKDKSAIPPGIPAQNGRVQNKIGIWEGGTWSIPSYRRSNPELEYAVMLWPPKVNRSHLIACGSSAMSEGSKDKDATWIFIRWWNSVERQLRFYQFGGGNCPTRTSAFENSLFTNDPMWQAVLPGFNFPETKARPLCVRWNELAESITPYLMEAFRGVKTPKQALEEGTQAANAFWKSIGGTPALIEQ